MAASSGSGPNHPRKVPGIAVSNWRTWPHREAAQGVPRVGGALNTPPLLGLADPPVTQHVGVRQCAHARQRQATTRRSASCQVRLRPTRRIETGVQGMVSQFTHPGARNVTLFQPSIERQRAVHRGLDAVVPSSGRIRTYSTSARSKPAPLPQHVVGQPRLHGGKQGLTERERAKAPGLPHQTSQTCAVLDVGNYHITGSPLILITYAPKVLLTKSTSRRTTTCTSGDLPQASLSP